MLNKKKLKNIKEAAWLLVLDTGYSFHSGIVASQALHLYINWHLLMFIRKSF